MKPIYEPKGAAKEYGDYALNIYTGCPHRCYYCYSPNVLHMSRDLFHTCVEPRKNIVEETARQIEREKITGKLIHLCFSCDPYPRHCDNTVTREIIKLLKQSGNNVQILTKNGVTSTRDFDLLDSNDWFGISYAGYGADELLPNGVPKAEPNSSSPYMRLISLIEAKEKGINTWLSAEPVLNANDLIELIYSADYVDMWKIGKLNYHPSNIDWKSFGHRVEARLKSLDRKYYIKESLRKEMGEK